MCSRLYCRAENVNSNIIPADDITDIHYIPTNAIFISAINVQITPVDRLSNEGPPLNLKENKTKWNSIDDSGGFF